MKITEPSTALQHSQTQPKSSIPSTSSLPRAAALLRVSRELPRVIRHSSRDSKDSRARLRVRAVRLLRAARGSPDRAQAASEGSHLP